MTKKRKNRLIRVTAALLATVLAAPSLSYAKEDSKTVQQIHHVHIGNATEGGVCYEKEVMHIHEGSEEKGGNCFRSPVYHVHEGDEAGGGECYRTEVFHAHKGTEEEGEGCYGQAVYHSHEGSANVEGGCYGQPVYHKHTGNASAGKGCYNMPVYHKHTGSQASKGGCYGTPVYHSHTGSTTAGGGCYQKAVYHAHAGNETSGGACYGPIYHQHADSCYQEVECVMEYIGNLQIQREENGYCYYHGDTNIIHFKGTFAHQSCGLGVVEAGHRTCWPCQNMNMEHTYNRLVCGKSDKTVERYQRTCGKGTNTIESWSLSCGKNNSSVEKYALSCGKNEKTVDSYQMNCNKNEQTVDSYQTNCNKTESFIEKYALNCGKTKEDIDSYHLSCIKDEKTIDSYALSCEKTGETVDGYALSCQKNNENGYAEFSISNRDAQWTSGEVTLQAALQDPEGFLKVSSTPFRWEGKGIGSVESDVVKVKENGTYYVYLKTENEDVDEKELMTSIEVKNIDNTAPIIEKVVYGKAEGGKGNVVRVIAKDLQQDGSAGSGLASEAYSFDGGKSWRKENTLEWDKEGVLSIAVRDCCGNISVQDIEVNNSDGESGKGNAEENGDKGKGGEGNGEQGKGGEGNGGQGNGGQGSEGTGSGQAGNTDGGSKGSATGNREGDGSGKLIKDGNAGKKQGAQKGALQKSANTSKGTGTNGNPSEGAEANGNLFGGTRRNGEGESEETEKDKTKATTLPNKKEEYREETVQVEMPKMEAEPETRSRSKLMRAEAMGKVVKAVTFTVSSIMLASGLIYLIYLMFRSIQIFDCDGEGNTKYAGSCIMRKTEDGFEVRIPNMIWEHSATGQYSLRPSKAFAKKHKGKELLVVAGERKEAVWIEREIPLRIAE